MEFVNHTPFPAQAFEGIDQHAQSFHVLVVRQTLDFASGTLEYASIQAPLCEVDEFFGKPNASSARQESDFCHYKPKCDVIVNATAHVPQGQATRRLHVRLSVKRPSAGDTTPGSRVDVEAEHQLVDKLLVVTGARQLKRKWWTTRAAQQLIRWMSFSLIRPTPWKLTEPEYFDALPLRNEFAYGGECRIDNGERAAKRINGKHRLNAGQLAAHPDSGLPEASQPALHISYDRNPVGIGFALGAALSATKTRRIPAPRIEPYDAPFTAKSLWQGTRATLELEPAGMGIRPKSHPSRRSLIGTVDDAFIQGTAPLPEDFDFAVWNAAPADQQTELLRGDEFIELTNLTPPGCRQTTQDVFGNTTLRLPLPRHDCFALVRLEDGLMFEHSLAIDTVLIEPESNTLTLVWRGVLGIEEDAAIRVCELRMRTFEERDAMRAEVERIKRLMAESHGGAAPPPSPVET